MTKKVNNHISESDDLFKRLESGDAEGLDDFEKEAMEGFASLENPELARKLNARLEDRLSESYFKKKKNTGWVWSLAAGLVLLIGLSVVFYNYLGSHEEELAVTAPSRPMDPALQQPASDANLTPGIATEKTGNETKPREEKLEPADGYYKNTASSGKRDELHSRSIAVPEAKKQEEAADKLTIADNEGFASVNTGGRNANAGPVNAAPAMEEQSAAPVQTSKPQTSANGAAVLKENADVQSQSTPVAGLAKAENAKEAETKTADIAAKNDESPRKKSKVSAAPSVNRESLAQGNVMTGTGSTKDNNGVKGGGSNAEMDDSRDFKSPAFENKKFTTAQEYIKSEIDKDAILKGNVKSFRAKLSIDKDGKVSKVQFLASDFKNCPDCEKNLKRILENMPSWQAAEKSGKKVTETIEFVYP